MRYKKKIARKKPAEPLIPVRINAKTVVYVSSASKVPAATERYDYLNQDDFGRPKGGVWKH